MSIGPAQRLPLYTVCFCGTGCTRDEGEVSRPDSDKRIYSASTGYIPVRMHKEISGDLSASPYSVTVRGVGENDWGPQRDESEPLLLFGSQTLNVPAALVDYALPFDGGNQYSRLAQAQGSGAVALALHGANLAFRSGALEYNFIGHSRGAVECIMAAWFLHAYGAQHIPVNILAIDPVPGPGEWYGIFTKLPPNVVNYVGITSWDHLDTWFGGLVPRPNATMAGSGAGLNLGRTWRTLADDYDLEDPLVPSPSGAPQPAGYQLFACRGRHATVAGNATRDGMYDANMVSAEATRVPWLVYRLARAYLAKWHTDFSVSSGVPLRALNLRQGIALDHASFDAMGGGPLRTSSAPLRPYVRRVSSTSGSDPAQTCYLEDVVGDPPYRQPYPVTADRAGAGWVHWTFL